MAEPSLLLREKETWSVGNLVPPFLLNGRSIMGGWPWVRPQSQMETEEDLLTTVVAKKLDDPIAVG